LHKKKKKKAQDVLLAIHENIGALKEPAAYVAWQKKILVSICNKARRKTADKREFVTEKVEEMKEDTQFDSLPQEFYENKERRKELLAIIDGFPANYRTCLILHYFDNLEVQEIADIMQMSEWTVYSILRRSKTRLREEIETRYPKSYNFSLVPFTVLGEIMQYEMKETVSLREVTKVLLRSGLLKQAAGGAAGVSVLVKSLALTTVAAGILLTGIPLIYQAVTSPSASQPQVVSSTAMAAGSSASLPAAHPRLPEGDGQIRLAVEGYVYLDDPDHPTYDMTRPVPGTIVELLDENAGNVLSREELAGESKFSLTAPHDGTYAVRISLPHGTYFDSHSAAIQIDPQNRSVGWLAVDGSTHIELGAGEPVPDNLYISAFYSSPVSGRVEWTAAADLPLDGILVDLVDAQGHTITTATTDANGQYALVTPPYTSRISYTLRVHPTKPDMVATNEVQITADAGKEVTAQALFIENSATPYVELTLHGTICGCGHIDPDYAEITMTGSDITEVWWTISDAGGSEIAAGSDENALNEALGNLNPGTYILIVGVRSGTGASYITEREIMIR